MNNDAWGVREGRHWDAYEDGRHIVSGEAWGQFAIRRGRQAAYIKLRTEHCSGDTNGMTRTIRIVSRASTTTTT